MNSYLTVGALTQIGANTFSKEERQNNDFYATDPNAVKKLLEVETFNKNIWENACGEGNISKVLKENNYNVYSTDLIDRGYQDELVDFLNCDKKFNGDIITNPPYKHVTDFIIKSLDSIPFDNKVAMLLKLTHLEGKERYKRIYSIMPPKTIYVFSGRTHCAKNNEFDKYKSSAIAYAWFVWKKGYMGCSELKWI